MFDLTAQTAVVTGAATGIGEAIARRLASAGASVVVTDTNMEGATTVAQSLASGRAIQLDVSDRNSVKGAFSQIPRVDILVNNAGIGGKAAPLWEQTDEDWQRIIAVNLTGVFHCCRA